MKRLILVISLLLCLVLASPASAGHRFQDEAEGGADRVKLERTPLAPKKARGSMVIDVGATNNDISRLKYRGSIHSLAKGRFIYRIWLWDGFDEVKVPLTSFRADADGVTGVSGTRRVWSIERFDQVVVTRERTAGTEEEREPRIMLVGEVALLAN